MAAIPWAMATERAVGRGSPIYTDVVNRPLRTLLTESGYDPDASPFPGLMGPVFNVKAYGPVGTADDSATFAAAITAARVVNGIVVVPTRDNIGTPYLLGAAGAMTATAVLNLDGRVSLIGIGSNDGPILKLAAGANRSLIEMNYSQGNRIEHLRLEGNKANQTGTSHGIHLVNIPATYQDTRYHFQNLLIQDFLTDGVRADAAASEVRMLFVVVRSCGASGFTIGGSDTRLIECEAGSNGTTGLYLTAGGNHVRGGGYFTNGTYNIHVASSADIPVWITECDLDRAQLDNLKLDADHTVVSDCLSRDPSQAVTGVSSHIDVAAGVTGVEIRGTQFLAKSLTNTAAYLIRCNGALTNCYIEAVPRGAGTTAANNGVLLFGTLTNVTVVRPSGFTTFTGGDATPSVSGSGLFSSPSIFLTSGGTAITAFDDGQEGQQITILATGAITITQGATIQLQGAGNFVMATNDTLTLIRSNTIWREIGRHT